jgi:hypothetical protein
VISTRGKGLPVFFRPLMAALQWMDPQPQQLRDLAQPDWRDMLDFCDLAHLTLPLVSRSASVMPAWVLERAERNLADNRIRAAKIAEAYREIAVAFQDAGIDHVVVKGFTQCPDFSPELDRRMQSDIDLYCPRALIPAAQQLLEQLGYAGDPALKNYPADHVPEMSRRRGWQWRGNLYDPEMPPGVDLHYCLWNEPLTRVAVTDVDAFWERREGRQLDGLSFPALSLRDNLAFCALHILRDLLRGDSVLHHIYELAFFLHQRADDLSWWQSWSLTYRQQLRSLQAVAFYLAQRWFHCRCSPVVEHEIEHLPAPLKQWLERFWRSPLTGMFVPNKHGLWLHLALLPATRHKLSILVNSLFPFRLPRVGASAQGSTRNKRIQRFWPSQPHLRYVMHVTMRAAFHLSLVPSTLWCGLAWRCSRR